MGVHEVGGSVYRVDYEGWGWGEAAGRGGFFAQEAVERGISLPIGCSMIQQWQDRCVWRGWTGITYE